MTCASPLRAICAQAWAAARHACDWMAANAGWMAINLLSALGLMVVVFAIIGHASFAGFFLEVGHLAQHYRSAGPGQKLGFEKAIVLVVSLLTGMFALLRLTSMKVASRPQTLAQRTTNREIER